MKLKKIATTLLVFIPITFSSAYALTPAQQIKLAKSLKSQKKHLKLRTQKANAKGTILGATKGFFEAPENWFQLDIGLDQYVGVSSNLVYQDFGAPTPQQDIIVAVIDSGVDVNHEDLQGRIWINEDEIPNNGVDDDKNGYIDDVFGWNFIGAKDGMATIKTDESTGMLKLIQGDQTKQVDADTLEITREYTRLTKLKKELEAQGDGLSKVDTEKLKKIKEEVQTQRTSALDNYNFYADNMRLYKSSEQILKEEGGLLKITYKNVEAINANTETLALAKKNMLDLLDRGLSFDYLNSELSYYNAQANFNYNPKSDTRADIVKDNVNDPYERYYGNNDVIGPDAFHGTHVSGIIAANRDNNLGVEGITKNVKIMAIRAVPNGDERDKDVANSIYYAVDNGAKIINMSFGKDFSPNKNVVNQAVKYAQDHGVLLVHAAGNSNQNNDKNTNFPNRKLHGSEAFNWIEVGASSYKADTSLAAGFSNFGKKTVDIFAPGINIKSTTPFNGYDFASGTSMAAPVVSAVAALILSFNKDLSVKELKDVILNTSNRFPGLYIYKRAMGKVLFSDLSINGGTPNAYSAIEAILNR